MIEMGGRRNITAVLLAVSAALLLRGAAAAQYTVGDSFGWGIPRNNDCDFYQKWTADKTFHARDIFVFNWNGTHTVTPRSKEDYDSCNKAGASNVVTSGVHVPLEKNGTYYYICTVDNHCERGQKVALVIGDGINDEDQNVRDNSSAALSTPARVVVVIALSVLALCFF